MSTNPPLLTPKTPPIPLEHILKAVQPELEQVETLLQDASWGPVPVMPEVARHLVGAGGKRLRPLLCILSARLCDVPLQPALQVAVAGELMHTASLLHDDVVDQSPLRRGKPAAPRVFGNSACVLMGDALMARSITLLTPLDDRRPLTELARCVRKMAVGEILQLMHAGRPAPHLLDYFRVIEGKTSGLFAWCSCAGELTPEPYRSALRRFGRRLGMAFQIADDILDYAGDPQQTGKTVGVDLQEGKMTLPLFYACQQRPELRQALAAFRGADPAAQELAEVVEQVKSSGGVHLASAAAQSLLQRAHQALDRTPANGWRDHLHALADFVVTRKS